MVSCQLCHPSVYSNVTIAFFSLLLDINECSTNAHNCDANAFCSNSEGSYNCTCSPGYNGNGTSCTGKSYHYHYHYLYHYYYNYYYYYNYNNNNNNYYYYYIYIFIIISILIDSRSRDDLPAWRLSYSAPQ